MTKLFRSTLLVIATLLLTHSAGASEPIHVLVFGGHGASASQMSCWKKDATKDGRSSGFVIRPFEYPVGYKWTRAEALKGGDAYLRKLTEEINANPNRRYVIVGHSSGAAISNELANRAKNPKRIDLVNLDGFSPSRQLQEKVASSTCYYAKGADGLESNNSRSMKGNCLNHKAYKDSNCRTAWCLHFALINSRPPARLTGAEYKARGYETCSANLSFLDPIRPKQVKQSEPVLTSRGVN